MHLRVTPPTNEGLWGSKGAIFKEMLLCSVRNKSGRSVYGWRERGSFIHLFSLWSELKKRAEFGIKWISLESHSTLSFTDSPIDKKIDNVLTAFGLIYLCPLGTLNLTFGMFTMIFIQDLLMLQIWVSLQISWRFPISEFLEDILY